MRLNSCFLRPTRLHNPNGKSSVQPFLLYNGRPLPPKLPLSWGIWTPLWGPDPPWEGGPPNSWFRGPFWTHNSGPHDSLGESEPTIQTASRWVQPSSHRWQQGVPILYNWPPLAPQHCLFPSGISEPNLIMVSWAHLSPQPKRHFDRSAFFAGLTSVTERETNRHVDNSRRRKYGRCGLIIPSSSSFTSLTYHNSQPQQADCHKGQHYSVNIYREYLYSAMFSIQSAQTSIT